MGSREGRGHDGRQRCGQTNAKEMMPCTGNHYSALMFDTFMPLTGPVL